MFGLDPDAFMAFTSSTIYTSLMAGIISLTFAQYKLYMTRHEKDAQPIGKMVYLLACLSNSLAIFVTQITYYSLGLMYFGFSLVAIFRYITNMDEYDTMIMPESEVIIVILYFIIVLMPLKFIPILFSRLLQTLTNDWILYKNFHLNNRNRGGYDLPDADKALFMFLPCSTNDCNHIVDQSVDSPGFSYFSKCYKSKGLYRLKFEMHIFRKVSMHFFYLVIIFLFTNTMHIVQKASTVLANPTWLDFMEQYDYIYTTGERYTLCLKQDGFKMLSIFVNLKFIYLPIIDTIFSI